MASSLPPKRINRQDLYTNLEARVQYLHSFLDFSSSTYRPAFTTRVPNSPLTTPGDIEALISGAKYVRALVPAVVNIVYRKLLQYDVTARAFTTRNTSSDAIPDDQDHGHGHDHDHDHGAPLHEDSPQIVHRKLFLRAYLNKLCSDPSKLEFWEYLDKVGMMHVGLGRKHPLHIEYVHLGVCLGFIQDIMTEAILSHPRLHMHRKIALVKALNKVIWIQNDFMAKWHVREADEFGLLAADIVVDKEGYLHGRQILDDAETEESSDGTLRGTAGSSAGTPVRKGECPLSSGLPVASHRKSTSRDGNSEKKDSLVPELFQDEDGR
ncbi:hypothetical protein QQS21_000368 [Conoideocrella luteorostrata]|uniref:Globin-sensor domain-containing protein n=1 Tax=Conoideocrella luteorostrata TaxID=1105319 RepID=A0AAJ0CZ50_9HYPO|nr:hypothetical protein QQS21_000368 [Conoideocrella luteorostrata]